MQNHYPHLELWFLTGSQHLYGPETLKQVATNSAAVVAGLSSSGVIPITIVFKGVQTTPEEIRAVCRNADHDPRCAGVILWNHTFSPAKMWIAGLKSLRRPLLHLHTQFNQKLPWSTIDMDFMNLNQAAHGDREAGFLHTRLRLPRKVVAGHWSEPAVQSDIAIWARAAAGWHDLQGARFCRIGDNMRYVAVTEGDKVAAESRLGFSVNTQGVGDLVALISEVSDSAVTTLVKEYEAAYTLSADLRPGGARHESVREAARIELGLRALLKSGNFKGFTTTFEDLHGLKQLPGLAVQRLMAEGFGFGAEGDWKTAALLRAAKTMALGLPGGTSFMEDYTYDLTPPSAANPRGQLVLGSHMLEICPSIADHSAKPSLEVHPLGIGGKADPARLVFTAPAGPAVNASLIDLGNRFRLIVNEVDAITPPEPLPKLPVARAVWTCRPDFKTAVTAWIHAGGAHHTVYSYPITSAHFADFAEIAGLEIVHIDATTHLRDFRNQLRNNELYYHLSQGLGAI